MKYLAPLVTLLLGALLSGCRQPYPRSGRPVAPPAMAAAQGEVSSHANWE